MPATPHIPYRRKARGFAQAASLMQAQIRRVGETRGFAVSRLLTHWAEIAGPDLAAIARPVKVAYGRGGGGATLTLLTTGAQAPMLDMAREQIRARVNACYGYAAIQTVRITQTAPTGFAEGQAAFTPAPPVPPKAPDPARIAEVSRAVAPVADDGLRAALERLGANVLTPRSS